MPGRWAKGLHGLAAVVLAGLVASPGDAAEALPIVASGRATTPELKALVTWWAEGTAAGNAGDGYENRDRGHSMFEQGLLPQIARVTPEPGRDYGISLARRPGVTVANSSTARHPEHGGSNARVMYSSRDLMTVLYHQYRSNYLQIHPEHMDHDPGRNGQLGGGWGDLFPANTPYLITSQGSSRSDLVFVRAAFTTLAAFRPEAKRRLREGQALMPALQMLFRWCATNVGGREDRYLAPGAHPVVFDGEAVDAPAMARLAHGMLPDALPPVAQVQVVEEDSPRQGLDFAVNGQGEALADTPGAVARVWRGLGGTRRMVLSADASFDVNQRPLRFRWVATQGPAGSTTIRPLNERGSVVEATFRWHGWEPVPPDGRIESTRQDLAVFVSNGEGWSAPAFVTWKANPRERRDYDAAGNWRDIGHACGSVAVRVSYLAPVVEWLLSGEGSTARSVFHALSDTAVMAEVLALAPEVHALETAALARRRAADEAGEAGTRLDAELRRAKEGRRDGGRSVAEIEEARTAAAAAWSQAVGLASAAEATAKAANRDGTRRLEAMIRNWMHAPDLVSAHREAWAPLFAAASPEVRERLAAARRAAEQWGLRAGGEGWFVPGTGQDGGFTAVERALLAEYHVALLRELVLPPGIEVHFARDFADPALFPQMPWRDVAHRAPDGTLLGWRRYSGGAPEEFAWDGRRVEERDAAGRPVRTRDVTYRLRGGTVSAEPGPGTNVMVYDGPADLRGRIRR